MTKSLREIFNNLTGKWTFRRTIYQADLNLLETATGIATYSKASVYEKDTLYYEETGQLSLQGVAKELNFRRKYVYHLRGDAIEIILEDGVTKGQLFQTLVPQADTTQLIGSEHICKLDKYNGSHYFENESSFHIEYDVKGPTKNMQIKTYYEKINSDKN